MTSNHPQSSSLKVSVIVPVYNVSDYVERCLASIVRQTYPDIECILVDDGSTDDSMSKCRQFVARHQPQFAPRFMAHASNRGLSAARNTGTSAATGDYVLYVDSDDELLPDCVSLLVGSVLAHGGVDFVCGSTRSVPEGLSFDMRRLQPVPLLTTNLAVRRSAFASRETIPIPAWNKLVRRAFLLQHGIQFKEGLVYEDNLWSFCCAQCAQRVAFVYEPTYVHHLTSGSIMQTSTWQRESLHYGTILAEVVQRFSSPCYDAQLSKFLPFFINYYDASSEQYQALYRQFSSCCSARRRPLLALLLRLFVYSRRLPFYRLFRRAIHRYCSRMNRKSVAQSSLE